MPPHAAESRLTRWFGDWVRDVGTSTLRADATAALLAAVLVLPQGIAFAALAGLPPAWGLYTAVVPTIVAALAGSSRHVLTGPTNALSIALAASLAPLAAAGSDEYLRLAIVVTLFVGAVQVGIAVLRLGDLTNFIAPSVLIGFTTGAAVLIAVSAVKDLAAAPRADLPGVAAVAALTLATAVLLRWRWRRGPGLLIALVAGTLAAVALQRWAGWELARIGALPPALPPWRPPEIQRADLPRLATTALALTIVALGQTVAISKMLAARSGQVVDINRECLGQGLANCAGSLFSCFVACGSLNRSVPHYEAGARTPLAGVMAALLLLALVAVASPLLAAVPMAAISALLLVVAWTLIDILAWRELARLDRREAAVAAGTFVATLLLPLPVAVLAGVAASFVVYLHRTAHPALRTMGFATPAGVAPDGRRPFVVLDPPLASPQRQPECPQLKLLRMEGSVWFGAVAHVQDGLRRLRDAPPAPGAMTGSPPKHLLVMAKSMNFVDAGGAALWEQERARRLAMGGDLYFHRPRPEVLQVWRDSGYIARLGADHLYADKHSAIAAIVPRLDGAVCATCRVRLFDECRRQPGGPDAAETQPAAGGAPIG